MKITHIETYPVRIPLKPARHMITALGRHTESLYLLVRVGTDAGIEGVGEATVMPTWSGETAWGARALIDQVFAPRLIGVDPCALSEVERPNGEPFAEGRETIRPLSRTFIPSRVTDNPYYMATNYVAVLQALPEPLRSQLLYGDMRAGIQDDAWQLIPTEWVRAAQERWRERTKFVDGQPQPPEGQALSAIGLDVAHGGADKTVVSPRYGNWFAPQKKYQGRETDSGEKAAHLAMREMPPDSDAPANVDAIGYGSECHAELRKIIGKRAIAVNVSEKPDPPVKDRSKKYEMGNVRSAIFWRLREALDPVNGDDLMLPQDPELLGDLTAMKFEVRSGKIWVEGKDEIKKRLGRSPDCGDGVGLAHWCVKGWKLTADMFYV